MAKVKIIVIDVASGQTVKTMERSYDRTAVDAAEEVRDTLDTYSDLDTTDVEDA